MKLLVVSDSHGNIARLQTIIDSEAPFDYIIHCGDGVGDLLHVSLPDGAAVLRVSGNVDRMRGSAIEVREFATIGGAKVMITHGDVQHAHTDYFGLLDDAAFFGCDAVFFGHTHRQYASKGAPLLFNPGAVQQGCYGVITLGDSIGYAHKKCDG